MGALLSSLMRPLGHVIAKIVGAVRLTMVVFVIMGLGLLLLLKFVPTESYEGNFIGFMAAYLIIFCGTGIGKGSTTSMIPEIYLMTALKRHHKGELSANDYTSVAAKETATVIGITSAIGTFGAFLMPSVFDIAQNTFNDITSGIWFFIACNLMCLIITWWFYFRTCESNPLCIRNQQKRWIIVDKPSLHASL